MGVWLVSLNGISYNLYQVRVNEHLIPDTIWGVLRALGLWVETLGAHVLNARRPEKTILTTCKKNRETCRK